MTPFPKTTACALEIMISIAQSGDTPMPLHTVTAYSLSYVEQVVAKLKRAGLVKAQRGPHGGYLLARDARDINVFDVIKAISTTWPPRLAQTTAECVFRQIIVQTHAAAQKIVLQDVLDDRKATV